MMSRRFTVVPLCKERNSPLSLPLVLPSNCTFDFDTLKLNSVPETDGPVEFKLVPQAVRLLESITKPVAVVSICGPFRSGKSYFLSRMLGNKETFQLGHTMDACTRGIWVATSVLECEEFALVLLDTEGIAAPGRTESDSGVTKLLVLTMLMSSMFVYNSKNVPRRADLQRMSFLTSLSRMVHGEAHERDKLNFPDFLWILRDMDTISALSPTDYVRQILKKNKSCGVLNLFPSFHCISIPPPSSDTSILSDITSNLGKLSVHFNRGVTGAIEHVLDTIRVKVGYDSSVKCDGSMLACLIEQHFTLINKPEAVIPTFQASWLMAIELKTRRIAESLVREYDRDMRVQLHDSLPMKEGQNGETGETLMNVHLQVFAKKRLEFHKKLLSYHSQFLSEKLSNFETNLIADFDKQIAYLYKDRVVSGRLLNFIEENFKASEDFCTLLYDKKYREKVYIKLHNALSTEIPTSISEELKVFEEEYYREAIGPAVKDVFCQLRVECEKVEAQLRLIPGPVMHLRVVGIDSDRVKLKWSCPDINPDVVVRYIVRIKASGKDWNTVSTRKGHSVLVTGLKSSSCYLIEVVAAGEKYVGKSASKVQFQTKISSSAQTALNASAILASPIAYPCMASYVGVSCLARGVREKNTEKFLLGTLTLSLVPPATLTAAIPVVGSLYCHRLFKTLNKASKGDINEDDTEVLNWSGEPEVEPSEVEHPDTDEVSEDIGRSAFEIGFEELQDLELSSDENEL